MALLTREDVIAKSKRKYTTITLPSGGEVRIRSLTERERSEYEASMLNRKGQISSKGLRESRRRLIAMCMVGADDNTLFNTNGDLEMLSEMNAADADAVYSAARVCSGFDKDEDVEELAKNSSGTHDNE